MTLSINSRRFSSSIFKTFGREKSDKERIMGVVQINHRNTYRSGKALYTCPESPEWTYFMTHQPAEWALGGGTGQ